MLLTQLAYKAKNIASFNIWKGKLSLKLGKDDRNIYISDIDNVININLGSDEDSLASDEGRLKFLGPVR